MPQDKIVIRGAREHNLKNIDVTIPRDKLVVITGLSGSGKSSLAFDTIFAEGQRRYIESLSAYARQFLDEMRRSGYVRVRVDGNIYDLSDEIELDKQKKHTIEVVVDRLVIRRGQKSSPSIGAQFIAPESSQQEGRSELQPYKQVAERPALYDVNADRDVQHSEDGAKAEQVPTHQDEIDPSLRQRVSD